MKIFKFNIKANHNFKLKTKEAKKQIAFNQTAKII